MLGTFIHEVASYMQATDIDREIRDFIVTTFLSGRADRLGNDGSLLGEIVDSTGVIQLVMYLQERFSITVMDEEVVPANLDSIDHLVAFVARKLKGPADRN
jgi:acyl carrier protein